MKKKLPIEIKYVAPAELIPYAGNPRNNEMAIEPVKKSIEHFGFVNPIIARRSAEESDMDFMSLTSQLKEESQHFKGGL